MFLEVAGYAFPGSFEIDIDGRRVRHRFLNEQEQLALNIAVEGWTPENLAIWLDRQVHQMDIHHAELLRWLTDLILYLTSGRGMHITALTRCKFMLARIIRGKIDRFRTSESGPAGVAPGRREEQRRGRYSRIDAEMAGRRAHMMLWHSGAALLSILCVIYPMRPTVEMARLVHEHDGGWSHRFQSDLVRIEQYAECGCELVVTEPVTNLPELWEDLEADPNALWRRILDLSGYDLNDAGTTR